MASKLQSSGLALPVVQRKNLPTSSLGFDWAMVVVSVWWLGGLFIDGWAHSNIPQLETFFTPWHAVFYSGYLAVAFTLLVRVLQNLHRAASGPDGVAPSWGTIIRESLRGNRWLKSIPRGYELTALGLVIFFFCGLGDMTWHILLGIEKNTEALLSPTHLGLALGIGLALTGPLRTAWRRAEAAPSWKRLGPAIFALTFTFSLLTFFTSYASAVVSLWPLRDDFSSATRGITNILLTTGLTMGFVLLAIRRWKLPFGTFAFMLGLNGVMMAVFYPPALLVSLPTGLLGGLAADLLYRLLQPTLKRPESVRIFAFLVPLTFYIVYFVSLLIVGPIFFGNGILWSPPFWAGAPVIAGFVGFLLSYVMIPPASQPEQTDQEA
ncbi:MAG TPA: hypothetical protein VFN35_31825 [Ktedonobacteraceae bacterium]|nr:hypothetical protein [Ktedonobacteraceae bacterium]